MTECNDRGLRSGYTTGACAAAAAYAAINLLQNNHFLSSVSIDLPDGKKFSIPIEYARIENEMAEAAVRKYSGDDPDVTNGAIVKVTISHCNNGDINFFAGEGVGTITKHGLSLPPGEPAINPVPRQMIRSVIREFCNTPVNVTISIPDGRILAERTFNSRLGVVGGLSILGTTGIVRPFSRKAVQETIRYAMSIAKAAGISEIFLVPGNIGRKAICAIFSPVSDSVIEVSNEWGFSIDTATAFGFEKICIGGHPGKLTKIAMNIWDTHSSKSVSAFMFVKKLCEQFIDPCINVNTTTVEGLFQLLSKKDQRYIAATIASLIKCKVSERMKLSSEKIAVILTDMNGCEYGRSN